MPGDKSALFSSDSTEHYTPMWLLNLVVQVMAGIDLDPCADPKRRVPARKHYTKGDNGLILPWQGKVFMNPPYGGKQGNKRWISRLVQKYEGGWVSEAIALVPARTDTDWFQPLYNYPLCFIPGRLLFLDEGYVEQEYTAPFPSVLPYLGKHPQAFIREFGKVGNIMVRATT